MRRDISCPIGKFRAFVGKDVANVHRRPVDEGAPGESSSG